METAIVLGINELSINLINLLLIENNKIIVVDPKVESINKLKNELVDDSKKDKIEFINKDLLIADDLVYLMDYLDKNRIIINKIINNYSIESSDTSIINSRDSVAMDMVSNIYLHLDINKRLIKNYFKQELLVIDIGYLSNNYYDRIISKTLKAIHYEFIRDVENNIKYITYLLYRNSDYSKISTKINKLDLSKKSKIIEPFKNKLKNLLKK